MDTCWMSVPVSEFRVSTEHSNNEWQKHEMILKQRRLSALSLGGGTLPVPTGS